MAYATVEDVEARFRPLTPEETTICETLLEDAAVRIDDCNAAASPDKKKIVSCDMVKRVLDTSPDGQIPLGATQSTVSALGYSQSVTFGGGSYGELRLMPSERRFLGAGNKIGSYSPIQELAPEAAS